MKVITNSVTRYNMRNDLPWAQLAKYFAGELEGEELQKMERWINVDSEREAQVEKLYVVWKESGELPYPLDVDHAWDSLFYNMDKMDMEAERLRKISQEDYKPVSNLKKYSDKAENKQKPEILVRKMVLIAATIVIIVTAGYFSHFISQENPENSIVDVTYRVLETQNGERASYNLSDGSKIILHAGSKLQIPHDFNDNTRELMLEGEAYFDITHNPEKPFIVQSEFSYTQVIGTKFLVHAWPDESNEVEVIVSEGKVLFGDSRYQHGEDKKEAFITKNQKGVLSVDNGPVITDENDIEWYMGWTEGRLVFNNRELGEVLPRLERWYDIDIRVLDDKIMSKKITAEIDYSLPMTDVLQGIAMLLNLEFERTDRTITFN